MSQTFYTCSAAQDLQRPGAQDASKLRGSLRLIIQSFSKFTSNSVALLGLLLGSTNQPDMSATLP